MTDRLSFLPPDFQPRIKEAESRIEYFRDLQIEGLSKGDLRAIVYRDAIHRTNESFVLEVTDTFQTNGKRVVSFQFFQSLAPCSMFDQEGKPKNVAHGSLLKSSSDVISTFEGSYTFECIGEENTTLEARGINQIARLRLPILIPPLLIPPLLIPPPKWNR